MAGELIYFSILYLWGMVFVSALWPRTQVVLRLCTSLLWGFVGLLGATLLALFTTIPFTRMGLAAVLGISGVGILLVWLSRDWKMALRDLCLGIFGCIVVCGVIWTAWGLNLGVVTYDSVPQILMGQEIGLNRSFGGVKHLLASWGSLFVLIQSSSLLIGREYLLSFQPLIGASSFALIVCISFFGLEVGGVRKPLAITFAAIIGCAWLSTYFILFQCFLIHNNLIACVFFLLGVGMLWFSIIFEERQFEQLGLVAMVAYSLSRIEAPIFLTVVLIWYGMAMGKSSRNWRITSIVALMAVAVWYAWLATVVGDGTDILTPSRAALVLLVLSGGAIFIGFNLDGNRYVKKFFPYAVAVILLCAVSGLLWLKPTEMVRSAISLFGNLAGPGRWGLTWFIILGLMLGSMGRCRYPGDSMWLGVFVCGIFILLATVYFRTPYRFGWGDSANRIMTQFLPLAIVHVTMKLAFKPILSSEDRDI